MVKFNPYIVHIYGGENNEHERKIDVDTHPDDMKTTFEGLAREWNLPPDPE